MQIICKPSAGCIYLGTFYVHNPTSAAVRCRQQCQQQQAVTILQTGICWKLKYKFPIQLANFQIIISLSEYQICENQKKIDCGPMPNLMVALCSTPQFGSRPLLECRAVTLRIGERKTWEDAKWILYLANSVTGLEPQKMYTLFSYFLFKINMTKKWRQSSNQYNYCISYQN